MIICFNCSLETKEALDDLVTAGQYKDYGEAISSAVMNLMVLQAEILKKGAIVFGTEGQPETQRYNSQPVVPASQQVSYNVSEQLNLEVGDVSNQIIKSGIPEIFLRNDISSKPPELASMPSDVWAPGSKVPLDRWLFGQYNKLLPAKANCRALAHMLSNEPKGVPISKAASAIAQKAVALGEFLAQHDEQNAIGRDDTFSTAFPLAEENAEKGLSRYANQFVASVNKSGQVSGLLIDLKLINYVGRKEVRLLLTEIGWRFAILPNPILDGIQEVPTWKFSFEERKFFLEHIVQSVPAEDFAYRTILSAILEGANTPETIDTVLQELVSPNTDRIFSKSFLSSQRSGAISRMADLNLVTRVREGVRVLYTVTDIGKQYLEGMLQRLTKE